MVMNEAASAPVVSATSRETPTPLERASAYYPLHAATKPKAGTGHAKKSHRHTFTFTHIHSHQCVNVNTTDATTGAKALLLPAQNTHTLHDPIRDPEHARACEGKFRTCVT